jgi:hypothetical protein
MGEIGKWLSQASWADLAIGIALGLAVLSVLTVLAFSLLPRERAKDDGVASEHQEKEERRRLLCEDAKVLADLAIQRHMSDAAFLERFRTQPCYDALFSHFSEKFREHLTQPGGQHGRSELAAACRAECERLERQWRAG